MEQRMLSWKNKLLEKTRLEGSPPSPCTQTQQSGGGGGRAGDKSRRWVKVSTTTIININYCFFLQR